MILLKATKREREKERVDDIVRYKHGKHKIERLPMNHLPKLSVYIFLNIPISVGIVPVS